MQRPHAVKCLQVTPCSSGRWAGLLPPACAIHMAACSSPSPLLMSFQRGTDFRSVSQLMLPSKALFRCFRARLSSDSSEGPQKRRAFQECQGLPICVSKDTLPLPQPSSCCQFHSSGAQLSSCSKELCQTLSFQAFFFFGFSLYQKNVRKARAHAHTRTLTPQTHVAMAIM